MPEEFKYQDKKVGKDENDEGSLKNLVYKKFKSIDNKKGGIVRDDKEILNAGWLVVNDLIKQITQDKNIVWGKWALEPLNDLIGKKNGKGEYISGLKFEYDKLKGYKAITNNKDKINQIANMIDNAEKETLIRLAKNRTTQDSRNIIKQSNETNKNKPMFVMEGGNDYRKQTGCLIFTKASNPVRIDQALNGLFNDPNIVYEIDYSQCTNLKIKNKMTGLIGTQTCYLRYDAKSKTYTIRDKYGDGISQRAYIWEGVRLIPAGVRNWTAYQEQKKIEENLGKENIQNIDSNVKNMLRDIPSTNLNQYQQKYLFTKTDERILQLLKKAKKLGYELEPECVSKKFFGSGFMELHLNSGNSETDWTIWENPKDSLGSEIYNQLSSNAGEYKTYLTNRVKQKRQELDSLTKTETTDVEKKSGKQESGNESEDEKKKEQQHKQQVLYGIGLLETMINNYRESEGDSWLDNDDRNLVQIKQLIRNAKASITNANAIDDEVITSSFINPIRQKWALIKRISKTINSGQGQTYENPSYKQQYNQLKKVFFGSNNEQIDAIRDLGGFGRLFDKTETSFLQQEIESNSFNEKGQNFKVKYTKVNECIQKFYNYKVELSQEAGDFDESGNLSPAGQEKVKELDNLYEKAKLEKSEFANYLSSIGLLPPNWKTKNKMVLKAVESLQNKLNNTQKQLDNFAKTKDNLSEEQHIKKLKLEQKENKTEEDLKELQALEYLEQNTEERDRINEVTLNMMKIDLKYGGINQLLGSSLFESLTELGGGAVGNNSKVYNDIIGYGFRNASDENAKLAGEIATEIAITVAVCVVTGGAGAGAIAAMLNVGSKAARATKWVRLANNIQKLVRLNNLGMKGFRIANTAGKISMLTTHAAGLLIEGTVFNAATNTIHSAMNGTSLDSLNLNPTAKENVQTAAFLGALSISGRLTQGLMKAGGKTKLSINLMKGLEKAHLQAPAKFTTGLVTEMGSMLAAEQTINFVFGHDIVNPETGEIEKSRKPELPTQQELTQMIGMILAFKMVKPGLWQQYTQKLNEGTLEICRSVKANEILVRNPKTGEIVERINQDSINGNNKETETKSVTEKPIDSPTKAREATRKRQQELISKRQSHEKRKGELNKRKAELERRKSELLAQREANWRSLDGRENNIGRIQDILKNGHIITIDGLKYKFNGVKNGKAEFIIDGNAKKSAETSGKSYSEKVEVSSLEELLSSHFNLEPGNKGTNSGRYAKLNELIGENVEPLDRLQNKIRNKKTEIKTLEEEIARLEKGNNTIAKNDYFEQHKNEIIGKNVRIDGVKYRAEHINKDGAIQFKEADGNRNFTVSSFKQLAEKGQVNGFSDGLLADGSPKKGSETLTKSERDNHQAIRNLISGESEYLSSRNMDQTINQKRTDLQTAQQELKGLEDKLPASQTRQQAISERARRGEELNKELGKLETELNGVNRELGEADRLAKKYQDEIDGIEKELPTGQQKEFRQKEEQERKQKEEQERKQKEEQERKQKESNEGKDDIYSKTMSQQEKIEFNNAEKTNKAEFYINEGFNPKNVIYLPSGEKLYVTDKIVIGQARPEIVGYTLENGKMNIRLFYRSNSEGCWRSSGGVRISNGYSKGEFIKDSSYETTTKVDYKVGELFDKLDISKEITKQWYTVGQRIRLNQINNDIPYDEPLYREMKQYIKVESVMFPELGRDAVHFYRVSRSENVITGYNKLVPEGLNYSKMKIAPEKSYSYKHEYLGTVDVEAAQMKYKGKDVYIYFAKAKNSPNKVWIENIVYADAKINSFGVYDKQINAGPLVAKPMDYATSDARQVPGNRQGTRYGEKYMDIRDLYQGNPIIKEYKKLSGEKSYENNGKVPPIQQRSESQKNRIETKNEDKETNGGKDINAEEIQSRIDSDLSKLSNKQESGKVKLDRATKKTFQSGSFTQGIKNWINEHINIPNFSVPKEYIKNIRYKLIDNVTFWQNQLKLYYHEKILNKYKSIKTKIDKKMGKIDLESWKDEIDYINDTLEDLADLKEDLSNRHEDSDNIEIISNDVDRIIEIREEIVEEFHDIIDIDLGDNQIGHGQDFIPPNQEIIDMDFSSPDNIIDDFGFVA